MLSVLSLLLCNTYAADSNASIDTSVACKNLEYPRASLINEEKGKVIVMMLIDSDGKVKEFKIEKSSGFKKLDTTALNALILCKFKPAIKNGKPEQEWIKREYVWSLEQ